MDASYPPFEAFDADNKTIIGFDADLSDAIAAKLGVKAEHVNAGFDSILVGLAAGKYDIGFEQNRCANVSATTRFCAGWT